MTLQDLIKKWQDFKSHCEDARQASLGHEETKLYAQIDVASEILEDLKKLEGEK